MNAGRFVSRLIFKFAVRRVRRHTWPARIESRIYYLMQLGEMNMSIVKDMMDKIDSFKASMAKMDDAQKMLMALIAQLKSDDTEADEALKNAMMAFDDAKSQLDADTAEIAAHVSTVTASGGDAG
jgi:hypothetical protein